MPAASDAVDHNLKKEQQLQNTHKQAQCSLTPKCLGQAHELYLHALLYSAKFLRV